MPDTRSTRARGGRGLTTAGLIAVTAATLLMMAWAIFPSAALANQIISVNPGSISKHGCNDTEWHFVITQIDTEANAPASIHVTWSNGASADVPLDKFTGGTAHYATTANLDSPVTNATATIYDGWDGKFNVSHGPCETPPEEQARIEIEKQTVPDGDPTTFNFTGAITATLSDDLGDFENVAPGTYTVSEIVPAGWKLTSIVCDPSGSGTGNTTTFTATFNVEAGDKVKCVFTNTKDQTTTTPGGGGGGGTTTTPPPAPTTTTTTTPIVAPTTVHNTSTTPAAEVLPTTVRPGKLAFTGIEDVVPIGALALTLMTTGSGLLWAGSRRRRHDGSEDED